MEVFGLKFTGIAMSWLAVIVVAFAEVGSNINCIGFLYQPKFPQKKE
ncbi:cyclic lactone autoinducer peptide [Alkaliphilus metalliredigens]|nr:cyclic lactone autoinducer peptide [Alkaliphilus metalliredigens]